MEKNYLKNTGYERSSNLELLRILGMLLIIAYHYCLYGNNGQIFYSKLCVNQIVAALFGSWGLLGVDCFIFISAYFLIDGKFSSKKLFKIILQSLFYAIGIAAILNFTGTVDVSIKTLIKSIMAPVFEVYWYLTAYCFLYVIYPFLNVIINGMTQKNMMKFMIILTIMIPVYRTSFNSAPIGDFIFVIYLYLLMGYLKKNPNNWFERNAKVGFLVTSSSILIFYLVMSLFGDKFSIFKNHVGQLTQRYSCAMVICAIFLFYIFKNMKMRNSTLINNIAKTTFGIYLFHENPVLGKVLWDKILKVSNVYYSKYFILFMLGSVVSLFVLGFIIDIIRIYCFEKPFFSMKFRFLELCYSKIDLWMNDLEIYTKVEKSL